MGQGKRCRVNFIGKFSISTMSTPTTEETSSTSVIPSMTSPATSEEMATIPATGETLRKVVSIQDQSTGILPKKLAIVTHLFFPSLSLHLNRFMYQQRYLIASDFGTSTAIAWVGTAFLVAKSASHSDTIPIVVHHHK